jgi:hypothetical protein
MPTNLTCLIEGCDQPSDCAALQPLVKGDKVIDPHTYGICMSHYKEQWAAIYAEQEGVASYDEYLERQASQ